MEFRGILRAKIVAAYLALATLSHADLPLHLGPAGLYVYFVM